MKLFYISVPILRHGNLSAQRIQFYRASLRQCNSLHSVWDCGPHSQISYATRPYSARALYQCYGWSFIHFTNVLRGIVMGLFSRTSALSTQLSTLEMFVYRQFIFIFSQITTYICGPYQILTILFKLQRFLVSQVRNHVVSTNRSLCAMRFFTFRFKKSSLWLINLARRFRRSLGPRTTTQITSYVYAQA